MTYIPVFAFAALSASAEVRLRVCLCLVARLFPPSPASEIAASLVLLLRYLSLVLNNAMSPALAYGRTMYVIFFWFLFKVDKLLKAVDIDKIGTHAEGAKDRVIAASKTTLADIDDSATK